MEKPTIVERFADNGEHSHYALIETETGELLWSEAPEEEMQQVKNLNIPAVVKSVCVKCGKPIADFNKDTNNCCDECWLSI